MAKQKNKPVVTIKHEDETIIINPFAVEKKIRKPLPPPTKKHKSKIKYNRKSKHPEKFDE